MLSVDNPRVTDEMLDALMAPLPKDAVEKSKGSDTGKGYDTTGYGYQWVADRLNKVLGVGSWRLRYKSESKEWEKTRSGKQLYRTDVRGVMELGFWDTGEAKAAEWFTVAQGPFVGGHVSLDPIDAEKGAVTNAFKKAAAFLCGVGSDAYRGQISDDLEPVAQKSGPVEHEPGSMWAAMQKMLDHKEQILERRLCTSENEEQFLLKQLERFDQYGDKTMLSDKQADWLEKIWEKVGPALTLPVTQGAARAAEEPKGESVTPSGGEETYRDPDDDLPF